MKTAFRSMMVLCWLVPAVLSAQTSGLKLKLQLLPDGNTWGVYVKPVGISPSSNQTFTLGGTQVTVVMPLNYGWNTLKSVNGVWSASGGQVNGPMENPSRTYLSFAFVNEITPIPYQENIEKLLFTFKGNGTCPDSIYIIDNANDPFNQVPNSINSNPGNEYTVFDVTQSELYNYAGKYAPAAWNCHDNDNDGLQNANEDTNGNGVFDAGVDVSDLNDSESVAGMKLKLKLIEPNTWGVYVKPVGISPSTNQTYTIGGSQVTVVMPLNYGWNTLHSVNGFWSTAGGQVNGPTENPSRSYVSFAFINEIIPIPYQENVETLLFTFKGNGTCPDSIYLIDNANDPFNQLPNSINSNPSNVLTVFDVAQVKLYNYIANYAPAAWDCHDNDNDGIPNATEDSNGNGVFDAGVDASDLNSGCLAFTSQPSDYTNCYSESAEFTAVVNNLTNNTLSYQWQVSADGNTWSDITGASTGANFSGFKTATLSLSNITNAVHDRHFRLVASTSECTIISSTAKLHLQGPLSITDHPDNIVQCSGEAVMFCATVMNGSPGADATSQIHYNWQENTGAGWVDLVNDTLHNGINTPCLNIAYTTNLNGYEYRLKVWTDYCDILYSNSASIDLDGPIVVTDQPDNVTQCAGEGVTFQASLLILNASPSSLVYQWEESADNAVTWTQLTDGGVFAGTASTTLTITNVAYKYGYRYRLRFRTPTCDTKWTNYAVLTVEGPIAVTNHPDHKKICSGNPTHFSVQASNIGQGASSYQWQICVSGDSIAGPWINLPNSSIYNGTNTANFSIANVAGMNGFFYRALIQTYYCSPVASYAAVLTVEGPISITDQPDELTVCEVEGASFSAAAEITNWNTGDLQYQWQWSSDGVNFTNILAPGTNGFQGINTPTLSISNCTGLNGFRFRLGAKTNECNFVRSQPALLTVNDCSPICLKAKLQLLPDSSGWAVMAKAVGNLPSANAITHEGRFTVVVPADFLLDGFANSAGVWSPTNVTENVPGHPGRKYITFEMLPQAQAGGTVIQYGQQAVTLFSFAKIGDCPDSLYLLENVPDGMLPNVLSGYDEADTPTPIPMTYCGVYARKAWRCKKSGGSIPPTVVTEDSFKVPMPGTATDAREDADIAEGAAAEGHWFTASPNPANDYVNIVLSEKLVADGSTRTSLALWDMQGKKRLENKVESTTTLLDLSGLPAGVYFVALAQNGRVVERTKIVKH